MSKNINTLWVEKYRPTNIDDMVLTEEQYSSFKNYIDSGEIPQLLLVGSPGSGKTTIARILADSLIDDRSDLMVSNGSAVTGVDFIRDTMQEFMRTPIFGNSKHKICFIDEADYLSGNAFAAIRGISEQYSKNCRLIMTANYKYKIPDPILSRVKTFEFKELAKKHILEHCINILDSENINYDIKFVKKVILLYYPDVRRIINHIQGLVSNGKLVTSNDNLQSIDDEVYKLSNNIISGIEVDSSIYKIRDILSKNDVDLKLLYNKIYNEGKLIPTSMVILNKYINEQDSAMIPGLHFMACLYEIKRAHFEYKECISKEFSNNNQ